MSLSVTTQRCDPATALAVHGTAWRDLEAEALHGSPLFGADLMAVATANFAQEAARLELVLVWAEGSGGGRRLIGLCPFTRHHGRWLVPAPVFRPWHHDFCFMSLPLVHRDHAHAAFDGLIRWMDDETGGNATLLLEKCPAQGEFFAALEQYLVGTGRAYRHFGHHRRAVLEGGETADAYLRAAMPGKKRKELRRQRNRLADSGEVVFSTLTRGGSPEAVADWCAEFMALEDAGWKGRRGTAIARVDGLDHFLPEALAVEARRGDLLFWKLAHGGRPVAMTFAIRRGGRAWLLKIAHDEALARHSPGVLLMHDVTEDLLGDPTIAWVDSCALPDHPMINRIWRDRFAVSDLLIAGRSMTVPFEFICRLENARRTMRGSAVQIYRSFRKGIAA